MGEKHTPPPWRVQDNKKHYQINDSGYQVIGPPMTVAYAGPSFVKAEDARLVANAPLLLGELKALRDDMIDGTLGLPYRLDDDGQPVGRDEAYIHRVSALIAACEATD